MGPHSPPANLLSDVVDLIFTLHACIAEGPYHCPLRYNARFAHAIWATCFQLRPKGFRPRFRHGCCSRRQPQTPIFVLRLYTRRQLSWRFYCFLSGRSHGPLSAQRRALLVFGISLIISSIKLKRLHNRACLMNWACLMCDLRPRNIIQLSRLALSRSSRFLPSWRCRSAPILSHRALQVS